MSLPRGITLRRARPGDAPGVRALVEHLGYTPDDRAFAETFTQVARHPEAVVLILAEGVRVVGYLAFSHRPQIRLGGRVAVIDELAIHPDFADRGLGTFLVEHALELARGLACVRIDNAGVGDRHG
jgi:N-acetylglutamate synthase-like GNAT family acetyltransferase